MFSRDPIENLRWYIGARGRLPLGAFNWLLFLVFLPLLFWQIHIAMSMAGEVKNIMGGSFSSTKDLIALATGGGDNPTFMQKWIISALPYVLMLLLWPALIMRLRDVGSDIRWAHVIMFGNLLGLLNTWGLPIPFLFRFALGTIQFYFITILAMKRSV